MNISVKLRNSLLNRTANYLKPHPSQMWWIPGYMGEREYYDQTDKERMHQIGEENPEAIQKAVQSSIHSRCMANQ